MKNLIAFITFSIALSGQAMILIGPPVDQYCSLSNPNACITWTTSLPTVIIADSEVRLDSQQAASHLLIEAEDFSVNTPVTDLAAKTLGVRPLDITKAVMSVDAKGLEVNLQNIALELGLLGAKKINK